MGWNNIPDGAQNAEKIPNGQHLVRIVKVVHGRKKDGGIEPFESNKGDPQFMAVMQDQQDREAEMMITLNAKAAWVLKGLLTAIGVDLEAMDREMESKGITEPWKAFEDNDFAAVQLLDRPAFMAEILWEKSNSNGKDYARINPLRPRPGDHVPAAAAPVADDIPF
jgi:hypothetical protein